MTKGELEKLQKELEKKNKYPNGKISKDDEGALAISINYTPSLVHIHFVKRISSLAMSPETAEIFAEALRANAQLAKVKQESH